MLLFVLPSTLFGQRLSFALEQIDAQEIIDKGLTGKGVKIGIIDGGFWGANEQASLSKHFSENRVPYYKDFVTPNLAPYAGSKGLDDMHGTEVWQMIGSIHPETNVRFGLATNATYYLARTDHGAYEKRKEEKFLIQALDEMIKLGVQIVNISLGYTNGYARKSENYTPEQMDGKSSWITRSIDSVLAVQDVLIIVSAGNDGNGRWGTLSAPADSENVLTVGATKFGRSEEMNYSAKGSQLLAYAKPDISCFSTSGTSFSAPVITGLAACILQYDPTLTASEIKNLLIQASDFYPYPNNHIGHGVPSGKKLLKLLEKQEMALVPTLKPQKDFVRIPVEQTENKKNRVIIYHKNQWQVLKKELFRTDKSVFRIKRFSECQQSTVLLNNKIIEVVWKKS